MANISKASARGVSARTITVMSIRETPSFDMTTQQAVELPCCMEETRREASRLPKKASAGAFHPNVPAHNTSPHSFLKLVSHVLTIRIGQYQWDGAFCTSKQR